MEQLQARRKYQELIDLLNRRAKELDEMWPQNGLVKVERIKTRMRLRRAKDLFEKSLV